MLQYIQMDMKHTWGFVVSVFQMRDVKISNIFQLKKEIIKIILFFHYSNNQKLWLML